MGYINFAAKFLGLQPKDLTLVVIVAALITFYIWFKKIFKSLSSACSFNSRIEKFMIREFGFETEDSKGAYGNRLDGIGSGLRGLRRTVTGDNGEIESSLATKVIRNQDKIDDIDKDISRNQKNIEKLFNENDAIRDKVITKLIEIAK